jgi:hypothetical protein
MILVYRNVLITRIRVVFITQYKFSGTPLDNLNEQTLLLEFRILKEQRLIFFVGLAQRNSRV